MSESGLVLISFAAGNDATTFSLTRSYADQVAGWF